MSDTPCACGCGQDAATIERLTAERDRLVREIGDLCGQLGATEGSPVTDRIAARLGKMLRPPQNVPQGAPSAPEAPGQPGRGEEGSGGRTAGLVGILRQHEDQTDRSANDGCSCGYPDPRTFPEHLAEAILADPGPLLEALTEAGVLTKEESNPHRGHGCWQDPDEWEGWQECGSDTNERRYVTEWRPTDARP